MNKAKELVQELQEVYEGENSEDLNEAFERALNEDLKPDINNLLFQYLPEDLTISNAEILANVIYRMIRFPQEFLKNKSNR